MAELIIFVIALFAAIRGADWLGKASITVAKNYNVPPFVIGATLVSLATTLPELTIAFFSGNVSKNPLYGLGAVLGSPIINLGLILGILFIVSQTRPALGYYSRSVNIFILLSVALFLVSLYRPIGGIVSVILILSGFAYLFLEFTINQRQPSFFENLENRFEKFISFFHLAGDKTLVLEFVAGAMLLAVGCKFLVDSGVALANSFGVHDFYISTMVLAIGTSLPELFTMINSVMKKRVGLSAGNLIGASVIDITIGVGLATLTIPTTIPLPYALLFFVTIIALGITCLIALFRNISLTLVGGLLVSFAVSFIILLTIKEFVSF
ncbi:MAG TPA: hypothetical protein VLE47_02625 [Candidatus Saccharimonadales bacterium]|nr:hypothetical protein [Candidatus Saccharimonadales bacterium]